jgi:hypothetical protein
LSRPVRRIVLRQGLTRPLRRSYMAITAAGGQGSAGWMPKTGIY